LYLLTQNVHSEALNPKPWGPRPLTFNLGLQIIDSLESLRPPLLHGAITPSSVLVSRKQDAPSPPGGAILAGNWHVSLREFGSGDGGSDVRGASSVMLYMLTGKGEEDFEWGRDGSAPFLRQV
jgi:hypothetical protein